MEHVNQPSPDIGSQVPTAVGLYSKHCVQPPAQPVTLRKYQRNPAIDFTKGALVLIMVLYHSINYMIGVQVDLKYLSFLPPSFIFITGFLIGKVYLPRLNGASFAVRKRLLVRGVKLLAIFTILNIGAALLLDRNYNSRALNIDNFLDNATAIYLTGNGRSAIFEILVPISYLLILSAALPGLNQTGKWLLPCLCLAAFAMIVVMGWFHASVEMLNLVAVGLLGTLFSYIPDRRLEDISRYFIPLAAGYVIYLCAITEWTVFYWLQIVGVCLSVSLIYMLGQKSGENTISERVNCLGEYSLLAYILQIAALQILIRVFRRVGFERGNFVLSVVVVSVALVVAVELLRFVRPRFRVADICYRAAFN